MSVFSDGPDGSSGKKGFSSSRGGALAIEAIDLRRRKCSDCRGRLMRGRRVCKRAAMTGKELGAVLNLLQCRWEPRGRTGFGDDELETKEGHKCTATNLNVPAWRVHAHRKLYR
jgi:hypothetical protein